MPRSGDGEALAVAKAQVDLLNPKGDPLELLRVMLRRVGLLYLELTGG